MTESAIEAESDVDLKPAKEIPVVEDQGFFQHDTGDNYNGFFEAKKKDRTVKMHGTGTYKTAEGDIYSGNWDNDRLGGSEEVTITFTDGSSYQGILKDWSYSGPGKYIYPDSSCLMGEFVENAPVGQLSLIDPNGHKWLGKADQGFAWFDPVNHFYEMLEKVKDVKKHRRSDSSSLGFNPRSVTSKMKSVKSDFK